MQTKQNDDVFKYPSWHDEVRKDKKNGLLNSQLADKYGVAVGRVSQIVSENWQIYLVMHRIADKKDRKLSNLVSKFNERKFTFEPYDCAPPKDGKGGSYAQRSRLKEDISLPQVREFGRHVQFVDGKKIIGSTIKCYKCGKSDVYKNFRGSISVDYMEKEFSRRGWLVGKNKNCDMCPSCRAELRSSGVKKTIATPKKEEKSMGIETVIASPVGIEAAVQPVMNGLTANMNEAPDEAAREMSRADDRIITMQLQDVYIDENVGYRDDWTDAKVAETLNVPVSWVIMIRERSFGPEINASLRAKMQEGLASKIDEVKRLILIAEKKQEQMQLIDDKLVAQMNSVTDAVSRFEELKKNLATEDEHMKTIVAQFTTAVEEFRTLAASVKLSS